MLTLLRPVIRLIVGFIAIPLFRMVLRRVVRWDRLDAELTKDLEQWVRGSLLLLLATDNFEYLVFGEHLSDWHHPYLWLSLGLRLLLAVGVIESMPDQALFAIIHPGPERLLFPKGERIAAVRRQFWPFCKGIFFRHLDRTSSVLAIMAVIIGAPDHTAAGWICYALSCLQFLIIGLVSSRDKALEVLSEFDKRVQAHREKLVGPAAGLLPPSESPQTSGPPPP